MAGHLLMMERHRLAALVLQDRRGREVADAELGAAGSWACRRKMDRRDAETQR